MYCKTCRKNVRSISHWAKEHRSMLHKKGKSRKIARGKRSDLTPLIHQLEAALKALKKGGNPCRR